MVKLFISVFSREGVALSGSGDKKMDRLGQRDWWFVVQPQKFEEPHLCGPTRSYQDTLA